MAREIDPRQAFERLFRSRAQKREPGQKGPVELSLDDELSVLDVLRSDAAIIRAKLGMSTAELSLPKILEGGTWSAGRRIAAERRPGGGPPLQVVSDGTLF